MTLLEISSISKAYHGGTKANDNISLSIHAGEVFGLLGPNGAGKTTLVNQIIGLVTPNSGKISIAGTDVIANPGYARQSVSFQPQSQVPIEGVTPKQAIELVGRMRGGRKAEVRQRTLDLIQALEIEEWADNSGETLSGGVRRLTAFCMAAVVPGKLVILDEPTNDVDPLRRRLMWRAVRDLADRGSAVLLVTHNVLEAERSVDRLAIIDQGRVVAVGTPASLKERDAGSLRLELILEPSANAPQLPAFLYHPIRSGRRLMVRVESDQANQAVTWARQVVQREVAEEFSLGPATLEDVYVRLIGRPEDQKQTSLEVHHVLPTPVVQ